MSWKLGKGLTASAMGVALDCASAGFGSGPSPAPTLPTISGHQFPSL